MRFIYLFLLLLSLSIPTFAIDTNEVANENTLYEELSLEDAVEIAINNNYEIQAMVAQLPISETQLIKAKYRLNPTIGANSELGTGGSTHPVQIGKTFEIGGKRHWRIEIAKDNILKTELEIKKIIHKTKTEVNAAYTSLVIWNEILTIYNQRTSFYKSLVNIAEDRYEAGDISLLELERTKVELFTAENELNQANRKLLEAKITLNTLLGYLPTQDLTIIYSLNELKSNNIELENLENLISKALNSRLEPAIIRQDLEITYSQLKLAKSERVPNLYVEGGPARPSFGDNIWVPYVGFNMEMPIFNRKQGEIKESKASINYLERELARVNQEIKKEVSATYNDLKIYKEQLARFEKQIFTQANNIMDMVETAYQEGELSLTDALNVEHQNRNLKLEYFETLLNYKQAIISMEYFTGSI